MPSRNQYKTNEEYNEYFRLYRERNADKMRAYNREYNKEWRKEHGYHNEQNSHDRYPEKEKARQTLHYAIKSGKVKKEPCLVCGNPRSQGHHQDYFKPLEVIWFCAFHHTQHHRILKEEKLST